MKVCIVTELPLSHIYAKQTIKNWIGFTIDAILLNCTLETLLFLQQEYHAKSYERFKVHYLNKTVIGFMFENKYVIQSVVSCDTFDQNV